MILSDVDIRSRLIAGELVKNEIDWHDVQPASIDLHLGSWVRWTDGVTAMIEPPACLILKPGQFVLASTRELISIPSDLVGVVDGKSTNARRGLMIHVTAGYIDPGFEGDVTLELVNVGPDEVTIEAGMKIAQIRFHMLSSPCERPYGSPGLGSHYQGQRGPTNARD